MEFFDKQNPQIQDSRPWRTLFSFFLIILGSILIGQLLAALPLLLFHSSLNELMGLMNHIDGFGDKVQIYWLQGAGHLLGFTGGAWFFLWFIDKKKLASFLHGKGVNSVTLGWVLMITVLFMMINSAVISWNAQVHFPEPLQQYFRAQEDKMAQLTDMLVTFQNPWDFIIGFVVIAMVPAFGEELVFRGILQTKLYKGTGNMHLAIWTSAFLFGIIHFQFFGVVPRILLGALFGYIYYYSGSLWLAMVAHLVNNGLSVIMAYSAQLAGKPVDPQDEQAMPWLLVIPLLFLLFYLLYRFRLYCQRHFELHGGLEESV